jgi:Uma2 family endonuclease
MPRKDILKEPIAFDYSRSDYTYADYLNFDFEEMVELIRGKIFKMSPAPRVSHQEISVKLLRSFFKLFDNALCKLYHAPIDIVLPVANKKKETATTVVQPDLCVVCDLDKIEEQCINGAPDLVVEILSPHTRKKDLQLKYEVYEEVGVREYWIVMPEEKLIEVFALVDQKYHRIQTYTETDIIQSTIFPSLEVDLNHVFKDLK